MFECFSENIQDFFISFWQAEYYCLSVIINNGLEGNVQLYVTPGAFAE